jgi:hypothetical protein
MEPPENIQPRREPPRGREEYRQEERYGQRDEHFNPSYAYNEPPRSKPKKARGSRIFLVLFILLVILGIGVWFVSRVSGAEVVVTPKQQTISVDGQFTAQTSGDGLQFQTITIAKDGKLGVVSSGQQMANDKASGVIIIYNTSKSSQKLIASTRFESSNGHIFRISQPITIPAASGPTPGSVEAAITADKAGPEYNVGLADFTIPGFKGDPKYNQFYGRSKTPIQGGFSGLKNTVADPDLKAARDKIHTELANNLVNEAKKDIPTGYVLPGQCILYRVRIATGNK